MAYNLYQFGPCERKSKKIINGKKSKMVMCGYKSRGIIKRFSRSNEFHLLSDKLAILISKELIQIFPSWFKKFEEFSNPIGSFGRLDNSPFSTISITLDFFNNNHCDVGDLGYGFLIWFSKDHGLVNVIENKSFLHLPEYRVKIPIYSGGILLLEPGKTHHFICVSMIGENMIGIALCQKQKVFNKINRLNNTVPNTKVAISA